MPKRVCVKDYDEELPKRLVARKPTNDWWQESLPMTESAFAHVTDRLKGERNQSLDTLTQIIKYIIQGG